MVHLVQFKCNPLMPQEATLAPCQSHLVPRVRATPVMFSLVRVHPQALLVALFA
jgi:hypothetical protein